MAWRELIAACTVRSSVARGGGPTRILVVSSVGGHLTEAMKALCPSPGDEIILVINDDCKLPRFPFSKVYKISHAERDWRVLLNLAECARIIRDQSPDVVFSTGAGPAVPMALIAKLLGGAKVVFVETAAAISKPTLTGRLMYHLSDRFFYQWPALRQHFPRGELLTVVF